MLAKSVKKPAISDFAVLEKLFKEPSVRDRIVKGHLGIILERFIEHLHTQGYTCRVIRQHVNVVEHFGCWLRRRRVAPGQLSPLHIEQFLKHHLPRCHCPSPTWKMAGRCQAGLRQLAKFLFGLRRTRRVGAKASRATPVEQLLAAYDRHLEQVRGLCETSRRRRQQTARQFLRWRFGAGPPDWHRLQAREITRFVVKRARGLGSGGTHSLVACLRSFLGFLEFSGHLPQGSAQAVPRPRRVAAPVPAQVLEPTQWRRFLESFDRRTREGRRDYAIALCLGGLGLRSHEVAALTLEDLDWRAMTIRLSQTKQRRQRLLPLPDPVARAILNYLKTGRPRTPERALFVRHRAPAGRALTGQWIRQLVRSTFARCGVNPQGTHVLRHTWATWAYRRGADLKLIADVLGHRSWETTQRYTHVNLEELRQAALPWPRIKR